jgi:hypothetical protein
MNIRLLVLVLWLAPAVSRAQDPAAPPVPPGPAPAATPAPAEDPAAKLAALIAEGDALYQRRHEPATWYQTITKYKDALKIDAKNYGVLWRLARCYFFVAERNPDDDQKEELGMLGHQWGLRAIKANPAGVEGHYFSGIALGQYAMGISIITALAKGIDGTYTDLIGRALKIDRYYDGAGPGPSMTVTSP